MDDRDQVQFRSHAEERAKTLVIRCWFEHGDGDTVWLRGTVRDLTRGRAVPFEGMPALLLQLQTVIGDAAPSPPRSE